MAKPIYLFLLLPATFFLLLLKTEAAEEKHYPMLPAPAPITTALDNNSPVPPNQFLSNTWPSASIQPAKSSTTSDTTPGSEPSFSSLINQLVAQNFAEPSAAFGPAFNQILNSLDDNTSNNQTYDGLRQFWQIDVTNYIASISSFISTFINNLTNVHLPNLVGSLCAIVKSFFLNTDLTTVKDAADTSDLSNMLYQLANTIYGIALDLSLLLFILSIWRYWTQAAWHGSGSPMSAVGRLIATIALMLAWTTIYKFQISLSNEMLSALFPDSTGQIQFFDSVMSTLLQKTSITADTTSLFSSASADSRGQAIGSIMSGILVFAPIIGPFVPLILIFLAIVLIYELLYLIVLKAIQTALLTAQYVFAPFFLVFLSNPVTDNIASSFLRSFVEVSLWNFIWIGLLKVLIILLYSNFDPWGKILTTIGVLQLMMQVPQFLAHAKISMASDFVSPHFFAKALKDISGFDDKIKGGTETLKQFFTGSSAHAHHKEKSPTPTSPKDTFSFAGNDIPNNSVQPPPKLNHLNGQSNNNNSTQNTNSEKGRAAGYGSYAAGHTGTAASASATNLASGSSFAYASAVSMANALSIAIATVSNSSGSNSPDSPRPKPNPPKPGPSNPEDGQSGAKPSPPKPDPGNSPSSSPPPKPNSNPPKPNSDLGLSFGANPGSSPPPPKPNSKPPKPNSDLGLSFGANPSSSPPPPKPDSSPPSSSLDPNQWHGPPKKPGPGSAPQTNLNSFPDPNSGSDKVHISSSSKTLPNERERKVAHLDTFTSKTPGNSRLANNFELPTLQLTSTNDGASEMANSSQASPQIALNQTQAFHAGAFNYHLLKNGSRASRLGSSFYHPLRLYGASENLFSHYAYNLIFNHGNSPPLMGIPPIYPAPN